MYKWGELVMATYKRTMPDGLDYAVPSKRPLPPPPPIPRPIPPVPPVPPEGIIPPPPPPYDNWEKWAVYPYYPPYQESIEPVPCPPIPGRPILPPPPPPFPPYPMPIPEKTDECSKKLAKLSHKAKVLVQMIKDFEQRNKAAILTIGNNSYQFGTENVIDFNGDPAKGMYSKLICGDPIETLDPMDYEVDDTQTRVALKDPKDLLQSELARVREEITLVAAALNEEVQEPSPSDDAVIGTGE